MAKTLSGYIGFGSLTYLLICIGGIKCVDLVDESSGDGLVSSADPDFPLAQEETNCFFQCGNSRCIAEEKFCDGFPDCAGGSDEMFCRCDGLDSIPNGVTVVGIRGDELTANYSCKTGYPMIAGDTTRTCTVDGLWTGEAPTCGYEGNGQLTDDDADLCVIPSVNFISRYNTSVELLSLNVTCQAGVSTSFEAMINNSFGFNFISEESLRPNSSVKVIVLVFNVTASWRGKNFTELLLGQLDARRDNASSEYAIKITTEPLNSRPNILPLAIVTEENRSNVSWRIIVNDPDQGDLGRVTLTTDGMPSQFEIVNTDGLYRLWLKEPLDADTMVISNQSEARHAMVQFSMTATDGGGLSSTATCTLSVIDINDNSPRCQTGVRIVAGRSTAGDGGGDMNKPALLMAQNVVYGPPRILDIAQYCWDPDVTGRLRAPPFIVDGKDCNGALNHTISDYPFLVFLTKDVPDNVTTCEMSVFVTDGLYGTVFEVVLAFKDCPPSVDDNGFEWPKGTPGTYTTGICPPGSNGLAKRKCDEQGVYLDPVYNCTSLEVDILYNELVYFRRINSTVAMTRLQTYAAKVDSKNTTMYAGDVEKISMLLNRIQPYPMNEERVTADFLDVVNVMIAEDNTNNWRSLVNETGFGAERILKSVDSIVRNLAKIRSTTNGTRHYARSNLFMTLESRDMCDGDIDFPDRGSTTIPEWTRARTDNIQIACSDKTVFSSVIFRNVSQMISLRTDAGDIPELEEIVNGPVMSLSVYPESNATLESPVTITFQVFDKTLETPICSYWKFSKSDGNGSWASDGCVLQSFDQPSGLVVCRCNHLTNFAVLMSPSAQVISIQVDGHYEALSVISLVGCIISMICLFATVVVYGRFWKQLSSQRSLILVTLCSTLFVAYLIFMAGVGQTQNKAGCTAVAVLLHYVYLCVFFLTLGLGLILAKSVLMPFSRRKMAHFYLGAAYGIPLVIVAISMGATSMEGYGNEHFCWLSVGSGLIWAFLGPVLLIIVVNIVIIILVLRTLFSTVGMAKKTDKEKAIAGVRSLIVLVPVLGITWLLGIFAVNEATVAFQYLFAIFNSLQGLLIMITNCFMDRKVQSVVKPYISRRPSSSQSDSTTATGRQKGTKGTDVSTL